MHIHPFFPRCWSAAALLMAAGAALGATPITEQRYLSGMGPKTAVPWDFKISDGRRAGQWSLTLVELNVITDVQQ